MACAWRVRVARAAEAARAPVEVALACAVLGGQPGGALLLKHPEDLRERRRRGAKARRRAVAREGVALLGGAAALVVEALRRVLVRPPLLRPNTQWLRFKPSQVSKRLGFERGCSKLYSSTLSIVVVVLVYT